MHLGPKAKTDYVVLDAKLLLINMNQVDFFFFFFKNVYRYKNLTKLFTLVDVAH